MSQKRTILAIDEGTTGTTALLMDENLNLIAESSVDFPQHFPKPGWVEHSCEEIWAALEKAIRNVLEGQDAKNISAIGITNQRETICFWEKGTTKPISPAIVWQDRRTSEICEKLKSQNLEPIIQADTGLILDPYFSGTKVKWALENWDDVKQAYQRGDLQIGTVDSFLIARLTGGVSHVTDASNASRTLALNIHRLSWDSDLCKLLGIPRDIWPQVLPSAGAFGVTKGLSFLPDGIPITGVLGDQQSALLGQACTEEGMAKCTYGTGAFLLMNTGSKLVFSKHRLLTTVAWDLGKNGTNYALEGSTFVAGAAVQWLRDGLGMIKEAADIESLADSVKSTEGVTFVPSMTGLGAPHWKPDATGLFTGITRGTTRGHLARAVLEGIAFQVADVLIAMEKDIGSKLKSVHVDGGASANNLLMQMQSNILQTPLRRPKILETTSLGAVFVAGLGAGIWSDLQAIQKAWKLDHEFKPYMTSEEAAQNMARWNKAVERALV